MRVRHVIIASLLSATSLLLPAVSSAAEPEVGGSPPTAPDPTTTDPDAAFVIAAYVDFLDREPTAGELASATSTSLSGVAARRRVVKELSTSPEWVSSTVQRFYVDTLGRPGDAEGTAYWTNRIRTGRETVAEVAAKFYSSGEYFRKPGFGDNDVRTWVEDLYSKILLRDPANDQGGVDYWVDEVAKKGRTNVAYRFYQSNESRRTRVKLLYDALLKRQPDAAGLTHWAAQIQKKGDLALASQLAESAEYHTRAWNRYGEEGHVAGVSAGHNHTCALMDDGTAMCWGENLNGQLGDGTLDDSLTPVAVSGLTDIVAIEAGQAHTCALLEDATIRCWGDNSQGQLGDGTGDRSTLPVAVTGLTDVVQVSAWSSTTCAVLGDGTAHCWGGNWNGQLGDGTTDDSLTPIAVPGLTDVVRIGAFGPHTCAVHEDGTVSCWGRNDNGQLGDGTWTQRHQPAPVVDITNAVDVVGGPDLSCALLDDATISCWGSNRKGQLGAGSSVVASSTPLAVAGITDARGVTAGSTMACANLADGTARCWGYNWQGQLGDGTTDDSSVPVPVSGLAHVAGIDTSGSHTCVLLTQATVRCWGWNISGKLGDGTTTDRDTPTPVIGL